MNPHVKAICKLFEACRYRHDIHRVISDCIEAMAIAISNAVNPAQRETREARYLGIVGRYDRDAIEAWPKVLAELTLALEAEPGDVLGAVFSQLELHNTYAGQFFTPDSICRLMAGLHVQDGADMRAMIEQQGFITVSEPACGAGAMVIALAKEMREKGLNYQRHLHVTAVDVDQRAACMAYVQFSLLHIPAIVIVGNSLTLQEREHWYTPAHVLGGWTSKLASRATEADETEAAPPRLQMPARRTPQESQLTLF